MIIFLFGKIVPVIFRVLIALFISIFWLFYSVFWDFKGIKEFNGDALLETWDYIKRGLDLEEM